MVQDSAGINPVLLQLADELAASIAKRYRITREQAVDTILDGWSRQPALLRAADEAGQPQDLKRTRVYRDAADVIKREIYYSLRRYRSPDDAAEHATRALAQMVTGTDAAERESAVEVVARQHISTAERMPHLDEFFARMLGLTGVPRTVVDVGSGVLPLLVPWDGAMRDTLEYWALDRDSVAVAANRDYARVRGDGRLRAVQWDLADGWAAAHTAGLPKRVELGLLLKVVAVVGRKSDELLATLAQTPAERLVVSGSRVAMAKRQDIERRETRVVQRFLADYGFVVRGSFRTQDEFAFLVDRA